MSELTENIRQELKDKETRYIYDDDLLNTYIATQIKVLREQRGWTQQRLAEEAEMKQARISVLEDVNYSSWTANVLRRLAKAFDLRLTIKFEEFNTYFKDFEGIKREQLEKRSFEDDPTFQGESVASALPPAEIFAALESEGQKSNVVSIQDYLKSRAQAQRGTDIYENLVGSTSQSRRNRAS